MYGYLTSSLAINIRKEEVFKGTASADEYYDSIEPILDKATKCKRLTIHQEFTSSMWRFGGMYIMIHT